MGFKKLPSNSERLLLEIVAADNPAELLSNKLIAASLREDDEIRGVLRELKQEGYIDTKWASNMPYIVTINNSARTYEERLLEYEEQRTEKMREKKTNPTIFISHRSTDVAITDMLIDFFTGTGIPRESIFCSSLPGNDVSEKISDEVKTSLKKSVVNIAVLSHDYYQSAYCLNEAGIFWYEEALVIPIALPEISTNNMYGFLGNEYKLRRLDSDTDISYIYDTVSELTYARHQKATVITRENNKLRERYAEFLRTREIPMAVIDAVPETTITDITTDDERVVLYYILQKNVRKVSKETLLKWLNESEIYDVNVDNAFDLLASFEGGSVKDDVLELGIETFRKYSLNAERILPKLQECIDKHTKLASDIFETLWSSGAIDPLLGLFVAYIVDEKMCSFGDRWMADEQIESIKEWEDKNVLDATLSNGYTSCLEFFIHNKLVYASEWTSCGNARKYSLCLSLKEVLFNKVDLYKADLEKYKQTYRYELPF